MRRPLAFGLVALILLLLGTSGVLYQKYTESNRDFAAMKAQEQTARDHYADAFSSIAEIQDSLNAIDVGSGAVQMVPHSMTSEQRLTGPDRREVLDRIATVNASIGRTKERIRHLEGTLRHSGIKVASLEKMLATLKQSVADREQQVAVLESQVNDLQTKVTGLQTTVVSDSEQIAVKDQTLEDRRKELGTIYYVVGDKKALATQGVIIAKGGVLGLGKTVLLSGNFNESSSTALDTDSQTIITAPGTKVRVLSPQPPSSYVLTPVANGVELHILDPQEFRKVKHLVIMTG